MRRIRLAVALAAMLLGAAACGSPSPTTTTGGLTVVATTTVFADMVRNVGGSFVNVSSLVPNNGDVHTFAPRPSDVTKVAQASLLVMNGLGLDDWLSGTLANSASAGTPLIKLAVDLPGIELLPGEDPGTENPHLWMDVKYAELYVDRIAVALDAAEPAHAPQYDAQAQAYKLQLEQLDASVRSKIATIPQANRKLVTFHDAFPYYAREYGIAVVGVAVAAPGQDPSAAYTAQLIEAIKAADVKAIFSEQQFPTRLVDQLAAETGATVVSNLYDDALSDTVPSYEALITWDTDQLVMALR